MDRVRDRIDRLTGRVAPTSGRRLAVDASGATAIEYGIIVASISLVLVAGGYLLGFNLAGTFGQVSSAVESAHSGGGGSGSSGGGDGGAAPGGTQSAGLGAPSASA
ncbi:MAG TPA: Flp family type IVb pilin, partial [Alphaproteobacteria bacterium]|nr:Flp family type IVb pilin [Alphaproteobacteria bacterium]